MIFKGKTLQEHIWNSMTETGKYSVWDWVILFEHFRVPIKKDEDYSIWVKQLKSEGKIKK